ncbi:helix-turn-helix transcriptional regulator [Tumebacillus lipolyticus]|uniref:Helix-turn-helix transcriptional regulator n=1 Tax=Tumebacillus lipolyticus TaxID=1280370 RepID=A0ABW5A2F3_9BACL
MSRERLVAARKEKGWTQKQVIENLKASFGIEITQSYYGMIENGRTPALRVAIAICSLLDLAVNEIFFESNPTNSWVCCSEEATA